MHCKRCGKQLTGTWYRVDVTRCVSVAPAGIGPGSTDREYPQSRDFYCGDCLPKDVKHVA